MVFIAPLGLAILWGITMLMYWQRIQKYRRLASATNVLCSLLWDKESQYAMDPDVGAAIFEIQRITDSLVRQ